MRIPKAVALCKEALQLIFQGLTVSNDLSNRPADGTVSASTSWTIWYDEITGQNLRSSAADALLWASDQQCEQLTVLANHKVAKVTFLSDSLTASGVSFAIAPGRSDVPGSLARSPHRPRDKGSDLGRRCSGERVRPGAVGC